MASISFACLVLGGLGLAATIYCSAKVISLLSSIDKPGTAVQKL
jgi:hypothetical protein